MNKYDTALELFSVYTDYEFTEEPFRQGDYVYATDKTSIIQVRSSLPDEFHETYEKVDCGRIMNRVPNSEITFTIEDLKKLYSLLPDVTFRRCGACEGTGTVYYEFEYDGHIYRHRDECPVCGGTGTVDSEFATKDFRYGVKFRKNCCPVQTKYLLRLMNTMQTLEVNEAILVYTDFQSSLFLLEKGVFVMLLGYMPADEHKDFYVCLKDKK